MADTRVKVRSSEFGVRSLKMINSKLRTIHNVNHNKVCHSRESGNPDVVPAKAGNQYFKNWIPPYQVSGSPVEKRGRNDKLHKTCGLMYNYSELFDSQSGMTFIEVLLVVVIIGILCAVVIPRFNVTASSRTSADGAAFMVASDIRYAQEFAMANRISKSVVFTSGSSVYTFAPSSNLDPSGQLPSGVTIGSNFTITFNSLGEPTVGGGGSVSVSSGGQTKTINIVNYTGKVDIS